MKFYQKKWFKITIISIFVLAIIGVLMSEEVSIDYDVYSSSITYQTEAIPAKEAVYQDPEAFNLDAYSGEYVIGKSPSEYVSGNEEEFITARSGVYVAGVDFPVGVYDLEVESGSGNVFSGGLGGINEIMGSSGSALGDDFYLQKYDNHEFIDGEELEVSGVSIKLVPQTNDEFKIPAGSYDIEAIAGGGNVSGSGLNEIMGTEDKNDVIDMYVSRYDNASLNEGKTLKVSGVKLKLTPKEKILISEATEAISAGDVVEEITKVNDTESCMIDGSEVSCSELKNYDELISTLTITDTYTESLSKIGDEEECMAGGESVDCSELYDYDSLSELLNQ